MLMIKTSTKRTNSLSKEMVTPGEVANELGEEELAFYDCIKKDLTKLEVSPKPSVINRILLYSKTL